MIEELAGLLRAERRNHRSHPAYASRWLLGGVRPAHIRPDSAWIDDDARDAARSEVDCQTAHDHVHCGL